ncbi:MAG: MFS transporter [Clostridiales bacterium]|nr:MFS transporter [Clostridiales bacterium]
MNTNNQHITINVFSIRNFRLVFFGALVSELGAILYSFAVSFYILEITDNNAFLQGLYLALCGVASVLFTPIGGVFGDRFNKAKIMYTCDYLKGSSIVLATTLMLIFHETNAQLAILFVLGIIGSAVSGVFNPVSWALLPRILKQDQIQQANSYFSIKSSTENILGIILAGILYATIPVYYLFFFVGVCYIASGMSEMLIKYDYQSSPEKLTFKLAIQDMSEGFQYIKTKKALLVLLSALLFINFFFCPVTSNFLPFFIKTDLASSSSYLFDKVLTPELWSSLFSVVMGVSSLIGASILSSKKQPEKCGFKTALRIFSMSIVLIAITIFYWLFVYRGVSLNGFLIAYVFCAFAIGFLMVTINIPLNTVSMQIVDKDKLSKVTSISGIFCSGIVPIASVLSGLVLKTFGCTPLLAISSLGVFFISVFLLFNKSFKTI